MFVSEKYAARAFRFIDLIDVAGWRIKLYGIRYQGDSVDQALVEAALPVIGARLSEAGPKSNHYSVGFAAIHQGKSGNFVFVDWWADENELHHHVYVSASDRPHEFRYMTPTGLTACAWDLKLMWFEREAWVDCVLDQSENPDLESYLARRLNADY